VGSALGFVLVLGVPSFEGFHSFLRVELSFGTGDPLLCGNDPKVGVLGKSSNPSRNRWLCLVLFFRRYACMSMRNPLFSWIGLHSRGLC